MDSVYLKSFIHLGSLDRLDGLDLSGQPDSIHTPLEDIKLDIDVLKSGFVFGVGVFDPDFLLEPGSRSVLQS